MTGKLEMLYTIPGQIKCGSRSDPTCSACQKPDGSMKVLKQNLAAERFESKI